MYRLFRNRNLTKFLQNDSMQKKLFATAPSLEHEHTEFNYVKLLGTIISNVRTLPNGTKSLIVRTKENESKYSNHHVNAKVDEPMTNGDRIYVFGHLSSKPIPLDDGRLRQKLTIKSKYIRLRGHERNTENSKDMNNVQMQAKITSDIHHTDKYSLFTLVISHTPTGEGTISGLVLTEFHTVIVYDQLAISVAKNNINKSDRVLIEGKINYMPYKIAGGKKFHGGFIEAHSIKRID